MVSGLSGFNDALRPSAASALRRSSSPSVAVRFKADWRAMSNWASASWVRRATFRSPSWYLYRIVELPCGDVSAPRVFCHSARARLVTPPGSRWRARRQRVFHLLRSTMTTL